MQASIPKWVNLEFQLAPDVPNIETNSGHLQQLTMGLISNAAEAIGEKEGTVEVKTYIRDVHEGQDFYNALGYAITPGRYVGLQVSDTGCGMDDKIRARIFEPFFTTKFTGRGLGLAAVQGIVRSLHGLIDVTSAPGQGSVFTVLLPAREAGSASTVGDSAGTQTAHEQILVIDDEEIIGSTVKAALERAGYTVFVAQDGPGGLAAFHRHRGQLGLILLDMSLPDRSSLQVLSEIREADARVPVVISSGFSEADVGRRFEGINFSGTIQKPFSTRELLETVERILTKPHPAPASCV